MPFPTLSISLIKNLVNQKVSLRPKMRDTCDMEDMSMREKTLFKE